MFTIHKIISLLLSYRILLLLKQLDFVYEFVHILRSDETLF